MKEEKINFMKKRALITGLNGMDGSHLADFLLEKDYEVFGIIKNKTNFDGLVSKMVQSDIDLLKNKI